MTRRKNFLGKTNDGFVCENCGKLVLPLQGGFRNHCPRCLWSKHVDIIAGDRENACRGLMSPIGIESDAKRDWMIVHRCLRCGAARRNRAALRDPRQPDDFAVILQIAQRSAE